MDNFQLVRGIGPGIEQRLHNAGIRTFGELAAMTPKDIAALVTNIAGLSAERVVKLAWIEQARTFAAEHAANNHHSITMAAAPTSSGLLFSRRCSWFCARRVVRCVAYLAWFIVSRARSVRPPLSSFSPKLAP